MTKEEFKKKLVSDESLQKAIEKDPLKVLQDHGIHIFRSAVCPPLAGNSLTTDVSDPPKFPPTTETDVASNEFKSLSFQDLDRKKEIAEITKSVLMKNYKSSVEDKLMKKITSI